MTFVNWLEKELENRQWTRSKLAKIAGISASSLSHIYTGKRMPGSDVCRAIADALKISPDIVYREAGLLDPIPEQDGIIGQILFELGGVSMDDKDEILEFIRMKRRRTEKKTQYKTDGS